MSRLMVTFFEMFAKSREFRELFSEQEMLCMPHYDLLVSMSVDSIDKKYEKQFIESCGELVKKYLDILENDVSHYLQNVLNFRNTGKNADWGKLKGFN